MKVRLTEEQYNLIKEIVNTDEAFSSYIKEGYKLVVDTKGHTITFIIREVSGGQLHMYTTKDFPIDLKGVLLTFGRGSYRDDNVLSLTKTHKLKDGGDVSVFDDWEKQPDKLYSVKDVQKIDIVDGTGKVIETMVTDAEKAKSKGDGDTDGDGSTGGGFDDEGEDVDGERYLDMDAFKERLESNDLLKKVFFDQKELMGLIRVGNPTGISVMNKILNKYDNQKLGESGKKIREKPKGTPYQVKFEYDLEFVEGDYSMELKGSNFYKCKVEGKTKFKSVPFTKERNFMVFINEEVGNNKFKATVVSEYIGKDGSYHKIKRDSRVLLEEI